MKSRNQVIKFFLILGLIFIGAALASMPIFQTGYLGEIAQFDPNPQSQPSEFSYSCSQHKSFMFIAEGPAGLEIWDISNASYPRFVARFTAPNLDLRQFIYKGNYSYGLDPDRGVIQFNSSNLEAIEIVDQFNFLLKEEFTQLTCWNDTLIVQSMKNKLYLLTLEIQDDSHSQTSETAATMTLVAMKYRGSLNATTTILNYSISDDILIVFTQKQEIMLYNYSYLRKKWTQMAYHAIAETHLPSQNATMGTNILQIRKQNASIVCVFPEGYMGLSYTNDTGIDWHYTNRRAEGSYSASQMQQDHLYLSIEDTNQIEIINLLASPSTQMAQRETLTIRGGLFFISDSILWTMVRPDYLGIYTRQDLYQMHFHGCLKIGAGAVSQIAIHGDSIILGEEQSGFQVLNKSETPNFLEQIHTRVNHSVDALFLSQGYLYLCDYLRGVFVYNFTCTRDLSLLSSFAFENAVSINFPLVLPSLLENPPYLKFSIEHGLGMVLHANQSVSWLNVSNPLEIYEIANIPLEAPVHDLYLSTEYQFLLETNGNLSVWAINTSTPVSSVSRISTLSLLDPSTILPYRITVYESRLYLTTIQEIITLDITVPTDMKIVGYQQFPEYSYFSQMHVEGDFGYVVHDQYELLCVNVSNPLEYSILGKYRAEEVIQNFALDHDTVYLALGSEGMVMLDREYAITPNPIGDVILKVCLSVGIICFLVSLTMLEITIRRDQKKLTDLLSTHRFGIRNIDKTTLRDLIITLFPYLDQMDLSQEGHELISYCYYLIVSDNIAPEEYDQGMAKLLTYYQRSPGEIATAIINDQEIADWELARLQHEGGFQERILLENRFSPDHPMIKALNKNLQISTKKFHLFL